MLLQIGFINNDPLEFHYTLRTLRLLMAGALVEGMARFVSFESTWADAERLLGPP